MSQARAGRRDWRDRDRPAGSPARGWGLRILLAVATLAALGTVAILAFAPLVSWQTACIAIVLDGYSLPVLGPVPFGEADLTALSETLAGRAAPATDRGLLRLSDFETSGAIRDRLYARVGELPVRTRDTLFAYVRGQSYAVPPLLDDTGAARTDPLAGIACLAAADFTLRGERPGGLVPCRQVAEALGAAANRTTVMAFDLGDLQWDPRLGVLCSLTADRLQSDFAAAHSRASGENWVITSHDVLEFSATSPGDGRSLFAMALQRALAGEADAVGWGDGDGVVELDELARFVSTATREWSRLVSGGRHVQRPVVWKLGVGRVELGDVPKNVAIIRVPARVTAPVISRLARFLGVTATPAAPPANGKRATEKHANGAQASGTSASSGGAEAPATVPASPTTAETPQATAADGAEGSPARSPSTASANAGEQPDATEVRATPTTRPTPPPGEPAVKPAVKPVEAQAATANATAPTVGGSSSPQPAPGAGGVVASEVSPGAAPATATAGSAGVNNAADSAPTPSAARPAPPVPSNDPWQLLAVQTDRHGERQPSLIDYAPHVWRQAAAGIARNDIYRRFGGDVAATASDSLQRFTAAMQKVDESSPAATAALAASPAVDLIVRARRAALASGVAGAWDAASPAERALFGARNDVFALVQSLVEMNGRLAGGVAPVALDPLTIDVSLEQLALASRMCGSLLAHSEHGEATDDVAATAQATMFRAGMLREVARETLRTLFGADEAVSAPAFRELRIVLEATFLSPEQRRQLTAALTAALKSDPLPSPASAMGSRRQDAPRSLDRAARQRLAGMTAQFIRLCAASGATPGEDAANALRRIEADLAGARTANGDIVESERDSTDPILVAGAHLARLLADATVLANTAVPAVTAQSGAVDRRAGLLRILDPRDAPTVGESLIARLPQPVSAGSNPLSLSFDPAASPRVGEPITITARFAGDALDPAAAEAVFDIDPAIFSLRTFDGTPVRAGVPLSGAALGWRGGAATLAITPLTSAGMRGGVATADVRLTLRAGERVETARIALPLPRSRDLLLTARGAAATLTSLGGPDGWARSVRSVDTDAFPTLSLAAWPSGTTSWELGLENLSGLPRTVRVEVHSVARGSAPGDRDAEWQRTAASLRSGSQVVPPLLVADAVALPAGTDVVPLTLGPPKSAPSPPGSAPPGTPPPAGSADGPQTLELPAPGGGSAATPPLGSDLAVVIREGESKEGGDAFLVRVRLGVIHPRSFARAEATYDAARRQIAVTLASRDEDGLPPGGVAASLQPLPRDSVAALRGGRDPALAVPLVVARKPTIRLEPSGTSDVAVASWNGPERGTAHVTLDVHGYPRAFTFAVDCSLAADGRPQGPQRDWRDIRIERPDGQRSLVRAPAAKIPMAIAADAPADTFLASGEEAGSVAIVFRQIGAGLAGSGVERVAWSAASDRDVAFSLQPGGGGLAVSTTVRDWEIEASGEGFANVDVVAEARLLAAGAQRPLIDTRTFVFDGTPPVVDAPPSMAGMVGRGIVVPLRVSDDVSDGFFVPPDRIRPGVSGLDRVEWAIDLAGTGEPKEWQPAVRRQGVDYEVRIDTAKLPPGVRLPLLVRATDKVGLSAPPTRVWLDIAAEAASTKNDLQGRVILAGRGEAGVPVTISGPAGERTVRSNADGTFRFTDLEPGDYRVLAAGPVRNTTRRAEPAMVNVPAAPAPPPSITLELR